MSISYSAFEGQSGVIRAPGVDSNVRLFQYRLFRQTFVKFARYITINMKITINGAAKLPHNLPLI
jgi:hypothetical protein